MLKLLGWTAATVALIATLIVTVAIAPRCTPASPNITIGGSLLLAGCPRHG